jgi:dolichol-phosphate mannosyltransferase
VSSLVVLPTYQEADNVPVVLRRLRAATDQVDVVVVDDGSPDGTADIAQAVADELGGIFVLRRTDKRGLGEAYRAGFAWGLARVIGSRYVPGGSIPDWAWHRRLLSRAGNRYSSVLLGLGVADLTSGFRAYRADILGKVGLDEVRAGGYGFQIEMAFRVAQAGGRIEETPIRFVDRTRGESKMSLRITAEALVLVSGWGIRRLAQDRRSSTGSGRS